MLKPCHITQKSINFEAGEKKLSLKYVIYEPCDWTYLQIWPVQIFIFKFLKILTLSSVQSLSRVQLFVTPWTVAYQAPLSMGFSRQECWSGLPFPSAGDLPDPGIKPGSPALQADALPSEPPGKPWCIKTLLVYKNNRFWVLILYPEALLNSLIVSNNFFFMKSLGFLHICHLQIVIVLVFPFPFGCPLFLSLV